MACNMHGRLCRKESSGLPSSGPAQHTCAEPPAPRTRSTFFFTFRWDTGTICKAVAAVRLRREGTRRTALCGPRGAL